MGDLFSGTLSWSKLLLLPALFVGFTVHELAHAVVAFLLGDTTQVEHKRLSFNPLRHVSWLGMVAFLLIGLGWAKPVAVDPTRFRIKNPAFGMFLVSVAGAAANFALAFVAFVVIMATVTVVWTLNGVSPVSVLEFLVPKQPTADLQGAVAALTYYMLTVNLLLGLFNLLPLPPLDGFQALMNLVLTIRGSKSATGAATATRSPVVGGTETGPASPAQIHFRIGLDYHKEGQLDEAIARYRQAVAQDPAFVLAYYNEGLAYWAKGRWPLAAGAFKAAMRTGGDPAVHSQAGLRLRELGRLAPDSQTGPGPAPPPLEPGSSVVIPDQEAPPLDPALARRVWWQLAIGAGAMLVLAVAALIFVVAATMASVH